MKEPYHADSRSHTPVLVQAANNTVDKRLKIPQN